jgi:uncharacterized SAM-binding protein YcdF (DUF218 family)
MAINRLLKAGLYPFEIPTAKIIPGEGINNF